MSTDIATGRLMRIDLALSNLIRDCETCEGKGKRRSAFNDKMVDCRDCRDLRTLLNIARGSADHIAILSAPTTVTTIENNHD